jgi:hypothetical protein
LCPYTLKGKDPNITQALKIETCDLRTWDHRANVNARLLVTREAFECGKSPGKVEFVCQATMGGDDKIEKRGVAELELVASRSTL